MPRPSFSPRLPSAAKRPEEGDLILGDLRSNGRKRRLRAGERALGIQSRQGVAPAHPVRPYPSAAIARTRTGIDFAAGVWLLRS